MKTVQRNGKENRGMNPKLSRQGLECLHAAAAGAELWTEQNSCTHLGERDRVWTRAE